MVFSPCGIFVRSSSVFGITFNTSVIFKVSPSIRLQYWYWSFRLSMARLVSSLVSHSVRSVHRFNYRPIVSFRIALFFFINVSSLTGWIAIANFAFHHIGIGLSTISLFLQLVNTYHFHYAFSIIFNNIVRYHCISSGSWAFIIIFGLFNIIHIEYFSA